MVMVANLMTVTSKRKFSSLFAVASRAELISYTGTPKAQPSSRLLVIITRMPTMTGSSIPTEAMQIMMPKPIPDSLETATPSA